MFRWGAKRAASKETKGLPFRERISLATFLTWTAVASILIASLVAGYYALTLLYQNKLSDTWAIMFLELEHEGTLLADRLTTRAGEAGPSGEAWDVLLRVGDQGKLEVIGGAIAEDLTLGDFKLEAHLPAMWSPLMILSTGGESYLAHLTGAQSGDSTNRIALKKVLPSTFALHPARPADQGALYILTREGRLLYASDPQLTETNAIGRSLVQRFINAPIKQGQLELIDSRGMALYGFFFEVPRTNIVLFSEVTKAAALAPIREVVSRFLAVLALILIGAVVLLQFPLSRITGPVTELAHLALSVGQGRFDIVPRSRGLGELATLTRAFSSMASGLVERDRRVAILMQEQTEKARLEGELAIARRIQENLLPAGPLPTEAGLIVAAEYISATECAGDWYHYAYEVKRRETLVVIADVSGHGAGSSMFTAMIACLFDEFRSRDDGPFDMEGFARKSNDIIYRLGRQQWHATMMLVRHVVGVDTIDILLAGHPPPLIRSSAAAARPITIPGSHVLGVDLDFSPVIRTVPFAKGSSLLAYTDGLTEAANAAGKMYGRRRVRDVFFEGKGEPHEALSRLLDGWRAFLGGQTAQDDVCIIALKVA